MGFIFCNKYINTDTDSKQVECEIYNAILYFYGYYDLNGYENWESHLEQFFYYFLLTSKQKYNYAQLKLDG